MELPALCLLPRPVRPPLWRELGGLDRQRAGAPAWPAMSGGRPVLLVPRFLAGDGSLRFLAQALRGAGHAPHPAPIRCNVGWSEAAVRRLVAAVERLAEHAQAPVALVGHSRGGSSRASPLGAGRSSSTAW